MRVPVAFVCTIVVLTRESTSFFSSQITSKTFDGEGGDQLLLTPFLIRNEIQEAQKAATVNIGGVKSYSGFFTVNEHFNSNLFFWFFPSQKDPDNDPVLLWLQGGPGASSLFGLFVENGPFYLGNGTTLEKRQYSWTKYFNVIYIDNPVGVGFSFTKGGYAQNQTQVGKELYIGLKQFFTLFPHLQDNHFFLTGESYAGKYIPALAYTILKENRQAKLQINLKGMTIGNGLSDPIHQFQYGEYLYQHGLIDRQTKQFYLQKEKEAVRYMKQSEFLKAKTIFELLINGNPGRESLYQKITGIQSYYNYLLDVDPYDQYFANMIKYLNTAEVRRALHVGNTTFGDPLVKTNLANDIMQSVAPWVSELLEHYPILLYGGQLDIIVPYTLMLEYLDNLNFSHAKEYRTTAKRKRYYIDNKVVAYYKKAGNLVEFLIRRSGHIVPLDQPRVIYDIISQFVNSIK